jgi:hypothetical protein
MSEFENPPIVINDFEGTGLQILKWSQDPATWPKGTPEDALKDFKAQLGDKVTVPARFKKLVVVQGDNETFVLRIPPQAQAKESIDRLQTETNDLDTYGVAAPYRELIDDPTSFNNQRFFHSRVADYTIRGCR